MEQKIKQVLSDAGVLEGSEVKITKKSDELFDISVNGEYFDTYDIKNNELLNHTKTIEISDNHKTMTVTIMRSDLWDENQNYSGAKLTLPATKSEIEDVMERARVHDEYYTLSECELNNKLFEYDFLETANLDELNFLAYRISNLNEHENNCFVGYAEKQQYKNIVDLINATYNLENCNLISGIYDDENLGKFYVENDFIEELMDIPEKSLKYLDYTKIGKDARVSEKGIYTENGYFVNNESDFKMIYDGLTFPQKLSDEYSVIQIIVSDKDDNVSKISFPTDNIKDCSNCRLIGFNTALPIEYVDLSKLNEINALTKNVMELRENKLLPKFKAVLEYEDCDSVKEASQLLEKLDNYELYDEAVTCGDYVRKTIKMPEKLTKFFDFDKYGETLSKTGKTQYGIIKEKEFEMEEELKIEYS